SGYWQPIRNEMVKVLKDGKAFQNISELFSRVVHDQATVDVITAASQQRLAHPIDSHPPLSARLQNLGVTLQDVTASALQLELGEPDIRLIAGYEDMEKALNEAEHYILQQIFVGAPAAGGPPTDKTEPLPAQPRELPPSQASCWSCKALIAV